MADRADSFLREVDEELRRDQALKFLERYGVYLIVAAVIGVAGFAGYRHLQSQKVAGAEAAGARFETAVKLATDGKSDDSVKALNGIVAEGPEGYRILARLRAAGVLAKGGKTDEALKEFDALAVDDRADGFLRQFAVLQSSMLRLDKADWTDMQNRLSPLLADASPWRASAREVLALSAMKSGKQDEARKQLEATLGDRTASQTSVARAQELLGVLTDQEAGKSEPAAQPQAAPSTTDAPKAEDKAKAAPPAAATKKK